MTNAEHPFKPYLIEIRYGQFVKAVPTESSHSWWMIVDPADRTHNQQVHRSEFGRIRNL